MMAHLETWYRCLTCKKAYGTQREAAICRNTHPVQKELWAVGTGGKAVRVFENCVPGSTGSAEWALREADLSDIISERKSQIEMLENKAKQGKVIKFERVGSDEH